MHTLFDEKNEKNARNVQNLIALYDEMFNQKKPLEAARKYLSPNYIQHNPFLPDTADGTGGAFEKRLKSFPKMRVEVHRIIAHGDYTWAHVNFFNIYNNDPNDLGTAGIDIFKFDENGLILEHWDVLQEVVHPSKSANLNGMF
jgi:predicted SnoaL-like aldol condensation-catalyzing enzyme